MVQVFINIVVLLGSIGLSLGILFWKHFANHPGERARAIIATIIGTLGLVVFFGYVSFMTLLPGKDFITFVHLVLDLF